MNRRKFLKSAAGITLGLTCAQWALPYRAKCGMIRPITDMVSQGYLDDRIRKNIRQLKKDQPQLKLGETHCHSKFSDGTYEVEEILHRTADLGMDFIVITEHLSPYVSLLEHSLHSFLDRWTAIERLNDRQETPLTVYPGLEVSTLEGHLILVFPEEFLKPRKYRDFRKQFGKMDRVSYSMETTAQKVKPFGGISIIAHPNRDRGPTFSASTEFAQHYLSGLVDAIEDASTGHGYHENYSQPLKMASIGSSDDHFNCIIGTTVTGYDSGKHADFIAAVQARDTQAIKIDQSLDDFITAARLIF